MKIGLRHSCSCCNPSKNYAVLYTLMFLSHTVCGAKRLNAFLSFFFDRNFRLGWASEVVHHSTESWDSAWKSNSYALLLEDHSFLHNTEANISLYAEFPAWKLLRKSILGEILRFRPKIKSPSKIISFFGKVPLRTSLVNPLGRWYWVKLKSRLMRPAAQTSYTFLWHSWINHCIGVTPVGYFFAIESGWAFTWEFGMVRRLS